MAKDTKFVIETKNELARVEPEKDCCRIAEIADRKSTRLNSSHTVISYAVFCLKKKFF